MPDDTDKPRTIKDLPPDKAVYAFAFVQAFKELSELKEQEKQIAIRKAQLNETLKALGPLFLPITVDIGSMSLANAIRIVMASADRPITAVEMRGKLQELGFDMKQFQNPLASIHTALTRMVDAGELKMQEDQDRKRFTPGPELKAVPGAQPSDIEEIVGKMAFAKLGVNKSE